jgi:hypothetical protein
LGRDNRDRELEVIAVEIGAGQEGVLLVIHVVSADLQKRGEYGA